MSAPRSVVVTGVGLVTGLGVGAAETWKGLLDGVVAAAPVTEYDLSALRGRHAVRVRGFQAADFASRRVLRSMAYCDQLALAAATLAVRDGGFTAGDGARDGLYVGGSKEISDPSHLLEASLAARNPDGTVDIRRFGELAPASAYPLFYVEGLQAASLFYISHAFGLRGTNTYFDGSAEAGAHAVAAGYRAVRDGHADRVLVGAAADAASWWGLAKLDSLGLLSAGDCRPWGLGRDGTVPGDGAAFLLLETAEGASARGAEVYAELLGAASTQQSLAGSHDGAGVQRAVSAALAAAGLRPGDVGAVIAGGSGDPTADLAEARGLTAALGDGVAVTSPVASTGHLLAGGGALNAALAALSVHHGEIPPVSSGGPVDPACGVAVVRGGPAPLPGDVAVATGCGQFGQNVALVFRRPEGER